MIRSKFTLWVILPCALSISLAVGYLELLYDRYFISGNNGPNVTDVILYIFLGGLFLLLVSYELSNRVITVSINDNIIEKRGYFGLGIKQVYNINDMDGYRLVDMPSRVGSFEYLYLMLNDRKVVILSAYYHKNYKELKHFLIEKNIKFLENNKGSLFI